MNLNNRVNLYTRNNHVTQTTKFSLTSFSLTSFICSYVRHKLTSVSLTKSLVQKLVMPARKIIKEKLVNFCRTHMLSNKTCQDGLLRPWPPPLGKSVNIFWRDTLLKMGFQTYIFCSKVLSRCRKCHFRDPNFKKNSRGACPQTPLQLCRHYGLPLTKILATPLVSVIFTNLAFFPSSKLPLWSHSKNHTPMQIFQAKPPAHNLLIYHRLCFSLKLNKWTLGLQE